MGRKQRTRWSRRKKLLFTAGIILLALLTGYCFTEPYLLRVDAHTVESAQVPDAFDGCRIVFASDLHYGPLVSGDEIKRVVDLINAQDPDIVILGGDYARRLPGEEEEIGKLLAGVHAKLGKYAIIGNHDYWAGEEAAHAGMKTAGFQLLVNEHVKVSIGGESIYITGLDDLDEGQIDAAMALAGIDTEDFNITAMHNPKTLDEKVIGDADILRMDAALAGHTHGGQVSFFGLWSPADPAQFPLEYGNRWHLRDGLFTLTSNGTGVSAIKVRFLALPEINVITLRTGSETVFN